MVIEIIRRSLNNPSKLLCSVFDGHNFRQCWSTKRGLELAELTGNTVLWRKV